MFTNVFSQASSHRGTTLGIADIMGDNGLEVKFMTFERVHHGAFDKSPGANILFY
mgnify:FL=1